MIVVDVDMDVDVDVVVGCFFVVVVHDVVFVGTVGIIVVSVFDMVVLCA